MMANTKHKLFDTIRRTPCVILTLNTHHNEYFDISISLVYYKKQNKTKQTLTNTKTIILNLNSPLAFGDRLSTQLKTTILYYQSCSTY